MAETYLIWWTNQNDCERVVPLDIWPRYLGEQFESRYGRAGRGRLWVADFTPPAPESISIEWDEDENWLCKIAHDAGGVVIKARDLHLVAFLPGFVTTFAMELPSAAIAQEQGTS